MLVWAKWKDWCLLFRRECSKEDLVKSICSPSNGCVSQQWMIWMSTAAICKDFLFLQYLRHCLCPQLRGSNRSRDWSFYSSGDFEIIFLQMAVQIKKGWVCPEKVYIWSPPNYFEGIECHNQMSNIRRMTSVLRGKVFLKGAVLLLQAGLHNLHNLHNLLNLLNLHGNETRNGSREVRGSGGVMSKLRVSNQNGLVEGISSSKNRKSNHFHG